MNLFRKPACVVLLWALVGCSGAEVEVNNAADAGVKRAADAENSVIAAQQKTSSKPSVSHGKPGAPVELLASETFAIEPGVPALLTMALLAPDVEGVMRIDVSASDGLTILSPTYLEVALDAADHRLPIQVVAANPGRYYVHLHVALTQQGRESFRALSAIVQVGMSDIHPHSVQKRSNSSSSGSSVILLPAQETVQQE